ncbi:cell division protein FtsI/penicillin-binding protein 2 [Knoellia remsis]|uniref:Cell division protein FtsI/penicillin-binding protein 2 n=1 Tax=Knoellia remsis TaxID=407159 RepID=A0A2T0U822_9MICO|nr:cell division protein FtsI/penicillin-binding protein 2 [Knoellia remsis]
MLVLALVAGGAWGAWTWLGRDTGAARAAAEKVAAGLAAGELPPGVVTGEPTGEGEGLAAIVEDMEGAKHAVSVASVTEPESGSATATLRHEWSVPGAEKPWTYETPVELRKGDETWTGVWSPAMVAPDLTDAETLRLKRTQAERADILGPDGKPIVTERPIQRVGIDKTKVSGAAAATSARALGTALDINVDKFVTAVQQAGPKAFVEAITVRSGSPEEQAARAVDAPGVFLVAGTRELAPTATFARPILGTVGEATAEIIEKSGGTVSAGDVVGKGGIQEAQNAQLSGQPGVTVSAVGGGDPRVLFETAPVAGKPVTVTLDIATQNAAEAALADIEPASAIVAIRPSTGAVLAAASGPGSNGQSTATQGRFPPGSTFKTVSTLALLRSGVTPSTPVECTQTFVVDGRQFKNVDSYPKDALGKVPFSTAFANSCNTAFMRLGADLEPAALPTAAAGLGLTADPSLGVPTFLGSVPTPKPGTDEAASMIGQSKVQASPLGMATVAASIAAGKTVTPTLVTGVEPDASDGDGGAGSSALPTASPSGSASASPASPAASGSPAASPTGATPTPSNPITAAEAKQLQTLMRGVVEQGSADFLLDVPGAPVLAKTGTAEFGEAGALKEHAWMIGIQGDLAVAVLVVEGEGGASTAGPVLEKFLRAVA